MPRGPLVLCLFSLLVCSAMAQRALAAAMHSSPAPWRKMKSRLSTISKVPIQRLPKRRPHLRLPGVDHHRRHPSQRRRRAVPKDLRKFLSTTLDRQLVGLRAQETGNQAAVRHLTQPQSPQQCTRRLLPRRKVPHRPQRSQSTTAKVARGSGQAAKMLESSSKRLQDSRHQTPSRLRVTNAVLHRLARHRGVLIPSAVAPPTQPSPLGCRLTV